MDSNLLVLLGGVVSLIVGSIWYGPLFGKKWMEICGVSAMDEAKRKEMQKAAMPLYVVQFVLSLVQMYVLMGIIAYTNSFQQGAIVAAFMWIGFIMPTVAGSSMWNNDSSKVKWARFLIQAGGNLVIMLIFGFMIGQWG